jgi:MFS family permease
MVETRPEPSRSLRWLVLLVVSIPIFGNYYVYDCIEPLADLLSKQLHFSDKQIGLLQGIYSFPNIVMVLIGGVIVDRIGTRRALTLFASICLIGAVVTVLAPHLPVMATGRLLFGLGAESLIVATTTAVAKWFRGKELSFAFGINLMLARFGTWLAQTSPAWAKSAYESWRTPLLMAVGFAAVSLLGAIAYWILEAYAERSYHLGDSSTDKVVFSDIFKFGVSYWYIVALCIVFYSAIFPFETFAVKFFIHAHGASLQAGGILLSMLTLFTMFGTPLFGLFVDRVGKRALLMMFGSVLLIPVYLMMGYLHWTRQLTVHFLSVHFSPFSFSFPTYQVPALLVVTMSMMGFAFALIPAVMWPSVAYIVGQEKLGTAYGLMTMIQNIGLFGFNVLIGWANDHAGASATNPQGYRLGMQIFSILGFLGLTFAFLLRRRELGPHGHGLETITTATGAG